MQGKLAKAIVRAHTTTALCGKWISACSCVQTFQICGVGVFVPTLLYACLCTLSGDHKASLENKLPRENRDSCANTLRSGTWRRILTPIRYLCRRLSTQANQEPLVSRSGRCSPQSSRLWLAFCARATQGYTCLRDFSLSVDDYTELRSQCE